MRKRRFKNPALAAAMAKAGMTNIRLAKICNIHPVTISSLLNKRSYPKTETALKIAQTLGVMPEQLFPPEEGREDDE